MANPFVPVQAPGYDYRPSAGLAGLAYSQDRARYEEQAGLQDTINRAQAEATVRDLPVQSRGLEATTRGQELETGFAEAMHPGRVQAGLDTQGLESGQREIADIVQTIAKTPPGPDYVARIGQALGGNRQLAQHPVIQHILNTQDPKEAQQRAEAFLQQQVATTPAYRQAMDLGRQSGEYDLEGRRISGAWGARAAAASGAGRVKSLREEWNAENNPINKAALAAQILSSPDAPAELKREAETTVKQMAGIVQALIQAKQQPTFPGSPFTKESIPMPGDQQQSDQYKPGQVYPGKTGSYKYKGGDPKDKNSWEKVK